MSRLSAVLAALALGGWCVFSYFADEAGIREPTRPIIARSKTCRSSRSAPVKKATPSDTAKTMLPRMKRSWLVGRLVEASFMSVSPQANDAMARDMAVMALRLLAAVSAAVRSPDAWLGPRPAGSSTPGSPCPEGPSGPSYHSAPVTPGQPPVTLICRWTAGRLVRRSITKS